MKEKSIKIEIVKKKYDCLKGFLNERSRRIWAATEAAALGWGGLTILSEATGLDCHTIRKGMEELETGQIHDSDHIRKKGAGRKKITEKHPEILKILEDIVASPTGSDSDSPLKKTCRSTYKIAEILKNQGYDISQKSVYTILTETLGYCLQPEKKERSRKRKIS
ncbi:MAG: hypothetical protein BWK80_30665 [Desulfobacteraceae bacterium IS3]|nr:MAG: hypothetical protein BWK80_30665 [Desulfobacteraceae bacterium IS3]HAO20144.1 hypothetical protein [Desulfobacteraceae bacterium]